MEKCVDMYNHNSYVQSAVNTMKDFIKGGEITVESKDAKSKIRAQAFIESLEVDEWIDEVIENCIKTGNAYAEVDWQDAQWKIPYKIYPIADSSQIYINCDEHGEPLKIKKIGQNPFTKEPEVRITSNEEEYYIQKINETTRHPKGKYYQLSYNLNNQFNTERIYGIPINKRKIIHFKLNLGDTGIYARPYIASSLDDNEILKQIERSIAIIAKYKAVPRDILMYGDKDNPATDDEVNDFIIYLESLEKDESAIVNKPIQRQSLSWSGQDINLDYMIKHVNKKLIAGIAPDFMMGLGDQVNKATAQISLISYILAIYSKRHLFLKPLEKIFLKPFLQREGLKPCTLKFGELDFETKSEKTNRVGSLWTQNLITLNRALELLGETEIGDKGDVYYMEWQNELGGDQFGFPNFGGGMPQGQSPGMPPQQPGMAPLPNGQDTSDVFKHTPANNQKDVQDGGKMPFDTEQEPTNIPKFLPKKDLKKPGTDFNKEYKEVMKEIEEFDKKLLSIIGDKDKEFEDKKKEILEMTEEADALEGVLLAKTIRKDIDELEKEINDEIIIDKNLFNSKEKIHIIIDNDKSEDTKNEKGIKIKKITYQTLINNFEHMFKEPRTTEIYYKKNENNWIISFIINNIMIHCEISKEDIISTNILNINKKMDEMNTEERDGLIQAWKNKYLYKAIEEL